MSANQYPIRACNPSAADYARLPDVPAVRGIFDREATYVEHVRALMQKHQVDGKLALLAAHKHFEVPVGSILVLDEITLPAGDLGEIVHPVSVETLDIIHPVAFFFDGELLQPFKFARGKGLSMDPFVNFFADYVSLAKTHTAGTRFALKFPNVSPNEVMAEAEISHLGATVLVPARYIHDQRSDVAALMLDKCSLGELHSKDGCDLQLKFTNKMEDPHQGLYRAAVMAVERFSRFSAAHQHPAQAAVLAF